MVSIFCNHLVWSPKRRFLCLPNEMSIEHPHCRTLSKTIILLATDEQMLNCRFARMQSVCNHNSKILQHGIITRSRTDDACDPFVIITPRFYNIIASSPHQIAHTNTRTRKRSVCNHHSWHSKILQHHRIITAIDSPDRTHV